jgi:hypothetical protein
MMNDNPLETPNPEGTKISQIKDALNVLNIGDKLTGPYSKILDTIVTIDEKFSSIVSQMGRGVEYTAGIKKNLAEGAFEVIKLGGSIESAAKLQEAFLTATGKNVLLSSEAYKGLFAIQQTTGVAADNLLSSMENVGMSIKDSSDLMYGVIETSQRLGVNAKAVSSLVVTNLDKLNRYGFENGVDGLTKMAARASALRINMETVTNLADNLLDPEKSIEFASTLSRLGATSSDLLDPLRLMNLAQNDVGELQNQLGDMFKQYVSFDKVTKQFELLPHGRMMIKEFSRDLNIPQDQIEKMAFGTAKLDRALSEIDFSGFGAGLPEETQEAIANMAQMNKEGKYEIVTKSGDKQDINEFLNSFKGSGEELQKYVSQLQSEEGKSPQDKLVDLATQQLGKTGEMVAILNQYKLSSGLAISRTETTDKVLTEQRNLINAVYGERSKKELGPGGKKDQPGGIYENLDLKTLIEDPLKSLDMITRETTNEALSITEAFKTAKDEILKQTYKPEESGYKKKAEDSLKYPGGEVQFLPQDTIISLTQGPEFVETLTKISDIVNEMGGKTPLDEVSIKGNQFNTLNELLYEYNKTNSEPVNLTEKNEKIEKLITENFSKTETLIKPQPISEINSILPLIDGITKSFNNVKVNEISKPKVEERVENRTSVVGQTQTTTQEVKGSVNINLTVDVKGDNRQINEIFNDPLFVQKFKQKLDNIDFGFANTSQTSSLYNTQMIA